MHSVSFCSAFLFSAQLLNNILGTEYGFSFCECVWVWLWEWGSKSYKSSHSSFTKIVWFRDYWRREISCKARFYYPNKKVETYEVLTERDIEIFLVRVCERVWTTELNIKKGTRVEMLDLGTRSRKAGTVTVPLLLPKQWLRLVHRFHFHSNKFHLYVSQKEKKLLTRFEEFAGTLTPR